MENFSTKYNLIFKFWQGFAPLSVAGGVGKPLHLMNESWLRCAQRCTVSAVSSFAHINHNSNPWVKCNTHPPCANSNTPNIVIDGWPSKKLILPIINWHKTPRIPATKLRAKKWITNVKIIRIKRKRKNPKLIRKKVNPIRAPLMHFHQRFCIQLHTAGCYPLYAAVSRSDFKIKIFPRRGSNPSRRNQQPAP